MKKVYAILVALSALGIFVAGCGSKTEEPTKPADQGKDGGGTPAPAPEPGK